MLPLSSLTAFTIAAALLTITPGIDTALVLRTGIVEGRGKAMLAALGIGLGCLVWGLIAAAGLGALLAASQLAYDLLRWIGAAYLLWLGLTMIARPGGGLALDAVPGEAAGQTWLIRGLLTNLLNPKVGVFYISFLPQFLPPGSNVVFGSILLTLIHVALGLAWFALLLLAGAPLTGQLRKPGVAAWLDRVTGGVLIAFGLKLALTRR